MYNAALRLTFSDIENIMDGRIDIRLHIARIELPVHIPANEEEKYRKAAKLVTQVLDAYEVQFSNTKTSEERMYMALVDIASKLVEQYDRNDTEPFYDTLKKITSEVEDVLDIKNNDK